ncbi:hypothetical protein ACFWMS_25535 [Peribacillus butanolivorans]
MGYEVKTTILRELVKPYRATVRFETASGKTSSDGLGDVGMYV